MTTDAPKQKWVIAPKDHVLRTGPSDGCKVWFSTDNRWFVTQAMREKNDGPYKLVLWRTTGAKPEIHSTFFVGGHGDIVALSPDGRFLVHANDGLTLLDLTVNPPKLVGKLPDTVESIRWLAYSPDGRHIAAAGHKGVAVFDSKTLQPVWKWDTAPGVVYWLDWAADGRHLVTHNGNKTVYVLRLRI